MFWHPTIVRHSSWAFDRKKGCIIVVVQQIVAPDKKSDTKLFHPVSISGYVVDHINLVP
jgi:hypothetical protein